MLIKQPRLFKWRPYKGIGANLDDMPHEFSDAHGFMACFNVDINLCLPLLSRNHITLRTRVRVIMEAMIHYGPHKARAVGSPEAYLGAVGSPNVCALLVGLASKCGGAVVMRDG